MSSLDPAELRWRTAVHEAGHLHADLLNHLGPYEVNLATARGAAAYSCVVSATGEEALRLAVALLSGAAAERAAGFDDEETVAGEASDLARLRLLNLTDAEHQRCLEEATRVATSNIEEILRIAGELVQQDVTRGGALYRVLRHPLPQGEWLGRLEVLLDLAPQALVVFDGAPDGVIDTDVCATPVDPANARRLQALIGRNDLLLTAINLDDAGCSAPIREIQQGEGTSFLLRLFSTDS